MANGNQQGNNKYTEQWEIVERSLTTALISCKIIDQKFTGSVTFHFNQGGVTEIDKVEKSLKKKLFSV